MSILAFGEDKALKYGDIVSKRLAGKVISKRMCDEGLPGSLRYEAEQLHIDNFDLWTLLETLEGMCHMGTAKEIDDSHYKVLEKEKRK